MQGPKLFQMEIPHCSNGTIDTYKLNSSYETTAEKNILQV